MLGEGLQNLHIQVDSHGVRNGQHQRICVHHRTVCSELFDEHIRLSRIRLPKRDLPALTQRPNLVLAGTLKGEETASLVVDKRKDGAGDGDPGAPSCGLGLAVLADLLGLDVAEGGTHEVDAALCGLYGRGVRAGAPPNAPVETRGVGPGWYICGYWFSSESASAVPSPRMADRKSSNLARAMSEPLASAAS